jgi:2-polyprenyl-3-methyl-5-hydroxy-6-metoxy-1,4-benzoquinol methylase
MQSHDGLQRLNRGWWEANPMTYDWARTLRLEVGSAEFFRAVDERFFRSSSTFGHPVYPEQTPFSEVIDYAALKGKRVLEIGCGAGGQAAVFARMGIRITAIDITAQAVALSRRRFDLEGLPGSIERGDAERLAFAGESFDLVWSWGVIHHTADVRRAVSEINRVLKPGASAKIMVYHRHSLRNWIHGGLSHGVLRGKLLRMSYDDVLKSVTDGYIARQMTQKEIRALFHDFSTVRTSLTDLSDLSHVPGYRLLDQFLVGKVLSPEAKLRLDRAIMERWGWFLYVEAVK